MWTVRLSSLPLLVLSGSLLFSQTPEQVAHWSAVIKPATLKPGASAQAIVSAKIEAGWHIYSITQPAGGPTKAVVRVPDGQDFHIAGTAIGPKPETTFDKNFNMNTEFYQHSVALDLPLALDPKATAGTKKVKIDVRFQSCNDRLCLPPSTAHLEAAAIVRK